MNNENCDDPGDDQDAWRRLAYAFDLRFGALPVLPPDLADPDALAAIVSRRVHRAYSNRPVSAALVRLLCATALCAPSKSDLQQRDIIVVTDAGLRRRIADLLPHMPWVREAPAFVVFCANGARLLQVSALRDKPFPNDHLDLFFNAVGDAAIALSTCLVALESVGLGGCPISEIRNHAAAIDEMLALPERVIPFAGLCIGWPAADGQISLRLPLSLTIHENRYAAPPDLRGVLDGYDRRRESLQPFERQYQPERWGTAAEYGWSEQKARQYAVAQRVEFGAYVRRKSFNLT